MRITLEWLIERGVCGPSLTVFSETFPDGTEITRESLRRAAEAGLNVAWLAGRIATGDALAAFGASIYGQEIAARARMDEALMPVRARLAAALAAGADRVQAHRVFDQEARPAIRRHNEELKAITAARQAGTTIAADRPSAAHVLADALGLE